MKLAGTSGTSGTVSPSRMQESLIRSLWPVPLVRLVALVPLVQTRGLVNSGTGRSPDPGKCVQSVSIRKDRPGVTRAYLLAHFAWHRSTICLDSNAFPAIPIPFQAFQMTQPLPPGGRWSLGALASLARARSTKNPAASTLFLSGRLGRPCLDRVRWA